MTTSKQPAYEQLLAAARAGRLSRRDLIRRGVALGLTTGALGTILAACGGSPTATSAPAPTATKAAAGSAAPSAAPAASSAPSGASSAPSAAPAASAAASAA